MCHHKWILLGKVTCLFIFDVDPFFKCLLNSAYVNILILLLDSVLIAYPHFIKYFKVRVLTLTRNKDVYWLWNVTANIGTDIIRIIAFVHGSIYLFLLILSKLIINSTARNQFKLNLFLVFSSSKKLNNRYWMFHYLTVWKFKLNSYIKYPC